jgi:hypothetical protein
MCCGIPMGATLASLGIVEHPCYMLLVTSLSLIDEYSTKNNKMPALLK